MKYTATSLRAHRYEVLDSIASSGAPVHIQRKGVDLAVIRVEKPKNKRLPKALPNRIVDGSAYRGTRGRSPATLLTADARILECCKSAFWP
jgi:hypothetical protein